MGRLRAAIMVVLSSSVAVGVAAQEPAPPRAARPIRMVLASQKLTSVVDTPLHFRLLRVTLPARSSTTYSGPAAMVYVASGAVTAAVDGERRIIQEGEGAFMQKGQGVPVAAQGNAPAVLLHYALVPASDLTAGAYAAPATVVELHRTPEPVPGLKAGPHEFSLTRVSVQPKVPPPPMHQRSGAALYYVLSGTWTLHAEGRGEPRQRGSVQFEPTGFHHTWENIGDATGVLLQANISAEGVPEIIFQQRP
jgi:quercetin dioxygenase-like cupin family protein